MISLVIPALNEEDAIAGTILSLRKVLVDSGITNAEIILIDDGSSDKTGARAAEAGARVIRHPHNVGYGRALKSGIRAAKYDTIVMIDADLTYPAEAIPGMLVEYGKGFDMVVGARTGQHYRESAFKVPLRTLLKSLVEYTAGRDVPDVNSGLRVFSRQAILSYLDHLCDTFSFTTSLTLAYMLTHKFVSYMPISYHARMGSSKVRLLRDSLRTLQYIVQAIVYYNPIKIFLLLSLGCIALAAFGFLFSAIFHTGEMLAVGGLLLSVLMFGLGLLADLVRQVNIAARTNMMSSSRQGEYAQKAESFDVSVVSASAAFASSSAEESSAVVDFNPPNALVR
jgi:glycosyltransferase involved in cell wall biosynthesis